MTKQIQEALRSTKMKMKHLEREKGELELKVKG